MGQWSISLEEVGMEVVQTMMHIRVAKETINKAVLNINMALIQI